MACLSYLLSSEENRTLSKRVVTRGFLLLISGLAANIFSRQFALPFYAAAGGVFCGGALIFTAKVFKPSSFTYVGEKAHLINQRYPKVAYTTLLFAVTINRFSAIMGVSLAFSAGIYIAVVVASSILKPLGGDFKLRNI